MESKLFQEVEVKDTQCTGRTLKGKRCSRKACIGDKCKTHSKKEPKNNTQRADISRVVYHNHPPGITLKTCQACLRKSNKEADVCLAC